MPRRSNPRPIITCRCCGKTGRHAAHGWRTTCYMRWFDAGKPADGPPAPLSPSEVGRNGSKPWRVRAERLEDYAELTRVQGVTREQAAWRLGVTMRTVERYEAELRKAVSV